MTVEDDGRGISVADRCRLFQPFFTTKAHGTGLGLFVSRQILEDHAGTLSFPSEPGQGSTFFVRLPVGPCRASRDEPGARHCGSRSPADRVREPGIAAGATLAAPAEAASLGRSSMP